MGVVYRALDRLTGQEIALKQVKASVDQLQLSVSGSTTDFRLALAQEFRTLASLRHPNIIRLIHRTLARTLCMPMPFLAAPA